MSRVLYIALEKTPSTIRKIPKKRQFLFHKHSHNNPNVMIIIDEAGKVRIGITKYWKLAIAFVIYKMLSIGHSMNGTIIYSIPKGVNKT
ncbi:hypothetical protein QUS22_00355 [Wolbachia pipientis]|nr:hypothetical protein [Wolbachia pipientis]MDM8334857.1 hypothetical protein [Wolbachia pipientis]